MKFTYFFNEFRLYPNWSFFCFFFLCLQFFHICLTWHMYIHMYLNATTTTNASSISHQSVVSLFSFSLLFLVLRIPSQSLSPRRHLSLWRGVAWHGVGAQMWVFGTATYLMSHSKLVFKLWKHDNIFIENYEIEIVVEIENVGKNGNPQLKGVFKEVVTSIYPHTFDLFQTLHYSLAILRDSAIIIHHQLKMAIIADAHPHTKCLFKIVSMFFFWSCQSLFLLFYSSLLICVGTARLPS